jgi:hypothetical protein
MHMATMVEIHHIGKLSAERAEIKEVIEHALTDRAGDWSVSIIGSQATDQWEMRITGPNALERSYILEASAGEHEPTMIGRIVARMVPNV